MAWARARYVLPNGATAAVYQCSTCGLVRFHAPPAGSACPVCTAPPPDFERIARQAPPTTGAYRGVTR